MDVNTEKAIAEALGALRKAGIACIPSLTFVNEQDASNALSIIQDAAGDLFPYRFSIEAIDKPNGCTIGLGLPVELIPDGTVCIFDEHGGDSTLCAHSGKQGVVLRQLTEEECDIFEVGPMYKVRLTDGTEIDAFGDELESCGKRFSDHSFSV